MDFTGVTVVKAQLGNEIRRCPIHNDDLTFDELVIMLQRMFKDSLDCTSDIVIKCKDDDGDYVTIGEDIDLSFSLSIAKDTGSYKTLRLLIDERDSATPAGQKDVALGLPLELNDRTEVVKELRKLRDFVAKLADRLDINGNAPKGTLNGEVSMYEAEKLMLMKNAGPARHEFDPLTTRNIDIGSKRSDTPESQFSLSGHPPNIASSTDCIPPSSVPPRMPDIGMSSIPLLQSSAASQAPMINSNSMGPMPPQAMHQGPQQAMPQGPPPPGQFMMQQNQGGPAMNRTSLPPIGGMPAPANTAPMPPTTSSGPGMYPPQFGGLPPSSMASGPMPPSMMMPGGQGMAHQHPGARAPPHMVSQTQSRPPSQMQMPPQQQPQSGMMYPGPMPPLPGGPGQQMPGGPPNQQQMPGGPPNQQQMPGGPMHQQQMQGGGPPHQQQMPGGPPHQQPMQGGPPPPQGQHHFGGPPPPGGMNLPPGQPGMMRPQGQPGQHQLPPHMMPPGAGGPPQLGGLPMGHQQPQPGQFMPGSGPIPPPM